MEAVGGTRLDVCIILFSESEWSKIVLRWGKDEKQSTEFLSGFSLPHAWVGIV